ncbi:type II secretion system F family protein [Blastococcus sp. SYSU D00820]
MSTHQAAALLLSAAMLAWPGSSARVRARVARLRIAPPAGAGTPSGPPPPVRRWALAGAAGAAIALLLGGVAGLLVGAGAVGALERLLRRAGDRGSRRAPGGDDDLPVACDLLAVCLAAGVPVPGSLGAVAGALPGPLGAHLGTVAGLYRLGAAPRRAWAGLPDELGVLGRAFVRAGESGAAAVPTLRALAADLRTAQRARTEADVRRAGVWVLAPLGACFLPAFLCLGVAPLVLGIAGDVFG